MHNPRGARPQRLFLALGLHAEVVPGIGGQVEEVAVQQQMLARQRVEPPVLARMAQEGDVGHLLLLQQRPKIRPGRVAQRIAVQPPEQVTVLHGAARRSARGSSPAFRGLRRRVFACVFHCALYVTAVLAVLLRKGIARVMIVVLQH